MERAQGQRFAAITSRFGQMIDTLMSTTERLSETIVDLDARLAALERKMNQ